MGRQEREGRQEGVRQWRMSENVYRKPAEPHFR